MRCAIPTVSETLLLRNTSHSFRKAVMEAVAEIPAGYVMGYGDVASKIGYPGRARHVGFVLSSLIDSNIPWWRVIRSDGSIALKGDPIRGPIQVAKLKAESVTFRGSRVDMSLCRWLKA